MSRTAVVIYNLGGPDSPDAVRPFLRNLFSDPMILRVPQPIRWMLALFISWRRAPVAKEIYSELGGRSPILPETEKQAAALQLILGNDFKIFIAMRYWHPFADAVARDVADWKPDKVVLLPLYPQFSTTTTESFTRVWHPAAVAAGLSAPTTEICCWPEADGFTKTVARLTDAAIDQLSDKTPFRVLFSAHGLPQKIIDAGDPYAHQVERTAAAIRGHMRHALIDHLVCYQSRVGPLEWIKPYTEDEIKRAGEEKCSLVVVPVAFVSEHSETLVELDIEYAELATASGVPEYSRVPTASADKIFIESLANLVRSSPREGTTAGGAFCAVTYADCPCRAGVTQSD